MNYFKLTFEESIFAYLSPKKNKYPKFWFYILSYGGFFCYSLDIIIGFTIINKNQSNTYVRVSYYFIDGILSSTWITILIFTVTYLSQKQLFISISNEEKINIIQQVFRKAKLYGYLYFMTKIIVSFAYDDNSTELTINSFVVIYWMFRNIYLLVFIKSAIQSSFKHGVLQDQE